VVSAWAIPAVIAGGGQSAIASTTSGSRLRTARTVGPKRSIDLMLMAPLSPLIVAVAQPPCSGYDVAANALAHARAVRAAEARVVVFPEMSLTGYGPTPPSLLWRTVGSPR
jgi:hypothetical protein